jgi:glycosyltransferase involved in cell wall biosynthesis
MRAFEATHVARFSACSAVSDEDGDVLSRLVRDGKTVYTLPNGVDTEFFQLQACQASRSPEENAVVFTGSMDWLPNGDAASYFCKDILPNIWRRKPDTRFYIVGKGPVARSKEFSDGRIIQTGRVDDVREFTARSKVFVVPLRIGGGTRLKILEAMSMERAVVSTSIGAEGIDCTEDVNIVLADRADVFAEKVVSLFEDDERRRALGMAGRKLVLEKYDWSIVGGQLNRIYEDLMRLKSVNRVAV